LAFPRQGSTARSTRALCFTNLLGGFPGFELTFDHLPDIMMSLLLYPSADSAFAAALVARCTRRFFRLVLAGLCTAYGRSQEMGNCLLGLAAMLVVQSILPWFVIDSGMVESCGAPRNVLSDILLVHIFVVAYKLV
jgi:hypothetical protein